MSDRKLVVTYKIPDEAPEWFDRCVEDGDWSGILEYADRLGVESLNVVPAEVPVADSPPAVNAADADVISVPDVPALIESALAGTGKTYAELEEMSRNGGRFETIEQRLAWLTINGLGQFL